MRERFKTLREINWSSVAAYVAVFVVLIYVVNDITGLVETPGERKLEIAITERVQKAIKSANRADAPDRERNRRIREAVRDAIGVERGDGSTGGSSPSTPSPPSPGGGGGGGAGATSPPQQPPTASPGQGGTPPGQGGTPPGQGGTPPGQGGTPPSPPGLGGQAPPGHGGPKP